MASGKPLVRQGGRTQQGNISIESVTGLSSELGEKVSDDDPRLTDAREWSATTVTQAEAEAGAASTRRAWTAQRVRQAIAAWYLTVSTTFTRTLLGRSTAAQVRGDLGLGTAATRDVGESSGNVMQVGAGGWLGSSANNSYMSGYPQSLEQNVTQIYMRTEEDQGVIAYAPSFHFAASSIWGRLRVLQYAPRAWIQGGRAHLGDGWTAELIHTGNILTSTGQSTLLPMTQKAVTDAINARGFEDASGILTGTSGALSNDMSSFLSQTTKATMRSSLEVPQLNASATQQGGLKARLDGTTLYLTNNGTNP